MCFSKASKLFIFEMQPWNDHFKSSTPECMLKEAFWILNRFTPNLLHSRDGLNSVEVTRKLISTLIYLCENTNIPVWRLKVKTRTGRKFFLLMIMHHINAEATHVPSRQHAHQHRELFYTRVIWAIREEPKIHLNELWKAKIEKKLQEVKVFVELGKLVFALPDHSSLACFFW